jgi:putative Ca2+/H+ antiporter (TMEM165/GDT1 family)
VSTLVLFTTALTAAAEIGDKSQLMSLLLGMRFRRPTLVILGILIASVANHTLAALTGSWVGSAVHPEFLRWALSLLFLALALWVALPDQWGTDDVLRVTRGGIVLAPAVSFFMAELGDKSEVCVVTLAAKYGSFAPVVIGGTAGMMIANVPLVLFGALAGRWVARSWMRYVAAGCFATAGLLVALGIRIE